MQQSSLVNPTAASSLQHTPPHDYNPTRISKTIRQAQTMAFTTQLFYFSMKILFTFILFKYKTIMNYNQPNGQNINMFGYNYLGIFYVLLLSVNTYYILTAGQNPGYQINDNKNNAQSRSRQFRKLWIQQQISLVLHRQQKQQKTKSLTQSNSQTTQNQKLQYVINPTNLSNIKQSRQLPYCYMCKCYKKNRTKHCYHCGKCVRKFDHHCPWIGTCVGQANHCKFLVMLLFQTIQAIFCFYVCFNSIGLYNYKQRHQIIQFGSLTNMTSNVQSIKLNNLRTKHNSISSTNKLITQQSYSQQFGVFALFSFFMFLYIIFVLYLFLFHFFLIVTNITTNQLMAHSKAKYLNNIKGNPFNKGLFDNIKLAIKIPKQGHDWNIQQKYYTGKGGGQRSLLAKIWSNKYYSCF